MRPIASYRVRIQLHADAKAKSPTLRELELMVKLAIEDDLEELHPDVTFEADVTAERISE